MDLAIAIRIGSPRSSLLLVKKTIESIQNNIGDCSYRFILSVDPLVLEEVKDYIRKKKRISPDKFELFPEQTLYWADFINKAIQLAQDCEYFIKAHDDVELTTPDFFPKLKKILNAMEESYAWVSFDETSYLEGHWAPPTRTGFYKDYLEENAWERRKMFQFHALPDGWWKPPLWKELPYLFQQQLLTKISPSLRILSCPKVIMSKKYRKLLDMPYGPVKCHAPWNAFVLIKTDILNKIGLCENWQTPHALTVDEDWGLRALQLKYWNIWIPSLKFAHIHPLEGGDRSQYQIKNVVKRVGELFMKKWGFSSSNPTEEEINKIQLQHVNNYIPWSIGRYSYEWDYLKLNNNKKDA